VEKMAKYSVHSILAAAKLLSKRLESINDQDYTDVQIALHEAGISIDGMKSLVDELEMIDTEVEKCQN